MMIFSHWVTRQIGTAVLTTGLIAGLSVHAQPFAVDSLPLVKVAGKTCKQVDSCEAAVELWCNGCRRADADSDGIPCENICRTRDQVDEIRGRIGC